MAKINRLKKEKSSRPNRCIKPIWQRDDVPLNHSLNHSTITQEHQPEPQPKATEMVEGVKPLPKPTENELSDIINYVVNNPIFNYISEEQESIKPPESRILEITFEHRMYQHLEGITKLRLVDRAELLVWRQLNRVLASFYDHQHHFVYDATKINLAEEVRLNWKLINTSQLLYPIVKSDFRFSWLSHRIHSQLKPKLSNNRSD